MTFYLTLMQRDPLIYKCKSIYGNLWFSIPENQLLLGWFINPIHFTVGERSKKKILKLICAGIITNRCRDSDCVCIL